MLPPIRRKKLNWMSGVLWDARCVYRGSNSSPSLFLKIPVANERRGELDLCFFRASGQLDRRLKGDVIHFEKVVLRLQSSSPYESSMPRLLNRPLSLTNAIQFKVCFKNDIHGFTYAIYYLQHSSNIIHGRCTCRYSMCTVHLRKHKLRCINIVM
jgi:hypothetical protein